MASPGGTLPTTNGTGRRSGGASDGPIRAASYGSWTRKTGASLEADEEGLLEGVKTSQLGDRAGWTRTTGCGAVDPDGFLYILGRADQAIIQAVASRSCPRTSRRLERDPRVRGAAVVGRADARLGAVPVAAVELRPGTQVAADLLAEAAKVLAHYELPDELRVVDALPRTPAGKVDLATVAELFTES